MVTDVRLYIVMPELYFGLEVRIKQDRRIREGFLEVIFEA